MLQQGYFTQHSERLDATDSLMAIITDQIGIGYVDKAAMTLTSPSWLGYRLHSCRTLTSSPFR